MAAEAREWEGLQYHAPPKPLPEGAKTEEWPRFLGARDEPVSGETELAREFPESGPPIVWECRKGEGYASPAIAEGRLVLFHRLNGEERIDCLEPETGKRFWSYSYPVVYRDDFGYSDGPRAGPVIAGGKVVTFGVTSWLKCLELATGRLLWEVDCATKYAVPQYFFGSGASPLVKDGLVIVNLGGEEGQCVAAFDVNTGEEKWITRHEWGQSYASPIPVRWRDRDRVLVFAGGKSSPATGGLLSVDPKTGGVDDAFFWRARRYASVNASSPVRCGENRVFITQSYVDRNSPCNGGVMLEAGEDGKFKEIWRDAEFGCHWMTPVFKDGRLYAFSGEKDRLCDLVCYDAATGKRLWKERPAWEYKSPRGVRVPMSFYRGSLLLADGRFLCLGEWGTLAWLDLSPSGMKIGSTAQLFTAQQTWTLPALSRGLLYVCQNEEDKLNGTPARLICYDLRGEGKR